MKKYIKPEIEIVKYDVESSVMAPIDGDINTFAVASTASPDLSKNLNKYIPDTVDGKAWSTLEDGWTWEE